MSIKKLFVGLAVVALALSATVSIAGAETLTANQIMAALTANPALLQSLTALLGGSNTSTTGSAMLTQQLAVGSRGAEVTALQNFLQGNGYTIPAGPTGYFGAQTKAAVLAFQAAKGIAQVGQVGPQTRAAINAMMGGTTTTTTTTTTTSGCQAGWVVNPVTGASCTGTITTPGIEGTLSVTSSSVGVNSTIYEGDDMAAILGFKVEAKNSDIAIQRVKLDLGASTAIYNKIYQKVYVTDGSTVLASADLNSSTVVKDGGRYYITLAGINLVVPKNSSKILTIKADVRDSIDSTDIDTETYTVQLANDGIRGMDGAGIDQYSPATGSSVSRAINVDSSLTDAASLTVSASGSNPLSGQIAATDGSNDNEYNKLSLLTFDLKAKKDDLTMTDLTVTLASSTVSGAGATTTTIYLYDGSTEIDSAETGTTRATFSDLDVLIAKDSTKTLTIKADVRRATSVASPISVSVANADVTVENTVGDVITDKSGSAAGNTMYIVSAGPQFTIVGSPTITAETNNDGNGRATTTVTAKFNVNVKAVGSDVYLGTQSASSTFVLGIYKGGTLTAFPVASTTDFTIPSNAGVITTGLLTGQKAKITDGNDVTIPVTFTFLDKSAAGVAGITTLDSYAVGVEAIKSSLNGSDVNTSTFMAGLTDWRTGTVSLPQ